MQQNLEHFRTIFFEECSDLLATAENHLSRLSDEVHGEEDIHAIFRAVHSVKGGAGTFGFDALVGFAHIFETALDILRGENIEITPAVTDLLLRANDILVVLVQNAESGSSVVPSQLENVHHGLESFIQDFKGGGGHSAEKNQESVQFIEQDTPSQKAYQIHFAPNLDMMRFGNEPYLIFRELSRLSTEGSLKVAVDVSKLPSLTEFNPENCYLAWLLELETEAPVSRLDECFEFVVDECSLAINESNSAIKTDTESKSENLNSISVLSCANQVSASSGKTTSDSSRSSSQAQAQISEQTVHSIRVELDRIDRLVNTVGEMVIKQAMVLDCAQVLHEETHGSSFASLMKGLDELTSYTRELQESVMAIRAQPVKAVFSRMPRLVRELAAQLNKEVRLEMEGENTEIDKTVIERLGEPLTHMIRNALDHGIESAEDRVKAGKPAYGTIQLSAEHKSGRIVIKIQDDGRGINREGVLKKARDQGILAPDAILSGEEIDQLIFHPGFSTAAQVTNISGRGVGMDVVKKSIQALGGRITIQSVEGQGCIFNLMLPLTLAVLDGMLVTVGKECYVIPLIHILETIRPQRLNVHKLVGGMEILDVRNKNIPLVYLHQFFEVPDAISDPTEGIIVIVETEGGEEVGIVVDELIAQQQVVLKSLEANYDPIPGISAATILGNGRVSLILDVNALKKRTIH